MYLKVLNEIYGTNMSATWDGKMYGISGSNITGNEYGWHTNLETNQSSPSRNSTYATTSKCVMIGPTAKRWDETWTTYYSWFTDNGYQISWQTSAVGIDLRPIVAIPLNNFRFTLS